jgi:hypothetical protein
MKVFWQEYSLLAEYRESGKTSKAATMGGVNDTYNELDPCGACTLQQQARTP